MVDQRAAEVAAFYSEPDPAQAQRFLARYDVAYVILGQVERVYYPADGLTKLETGLGGALQPVFSNAGLTIYEVQPAALAQALAAAPP
jgi:uncharacterized membrane protein